VLGYGGSFRTRRSTISGATGRNKVCTRRLPQRLILACYSPSRGGERWASARARPRHGSRGNEGLGVDIGSFGRCQYPAHLRVAQPYGCDLRSMHDNMQLGGCI
jgi:hypothetical protein